MPGVATRMAVTSGRGVLGAMAMTGLRTMAGSLGLVERTPPEEMVGEAMSGRLSGLWARVPAQRREGAVEGFHWLTGGVAGAVFGAVLGRPVRA